MGTGLATGALTEAPFDERLKGWLEQARAAIGAAVLAVAELGAPAGRLTPFWRASTATALPEVALEREQLQMLADPAAAPQDSERLLATVAAALGVARAVALPLGVTPRLTTSADALLIVGLAAAPPTPDRLASLCATLERGLSEDRRRRLADVVMEAVAQAPDAIELTDREARLFYANAAWEHRFGHMTDDVLGQTVGGLLRDRVAPLHDEAFYQFTMTTLAEGRPWLGAIANRTRDGRRVISEVNVGPFTADDAGFLGNVAVRRDVAHRVHRDEALAIAHREFTSVLSAVPDGVVVLRDAKVYFANPAFLKMVQLKEGEVIGRAYADFVHPDDRERFEAEHRSAVTRVRVVDAQGLPRFAEISTAGVVSYEGKPAMILFSRDTTDYQVAQQRLAHADKLSAIGSLAAGVAHEINNPLAYLTLNLGGVRRNADKLLSPGDLESLDEALDGARRIRRIVAELRAFSRAEGRGPTEAVDVEKAATSALNIVQNEIRHRARLDRQHEPGLHARAEEVHLVQVLVNVLVNAAQSIPLGEAIASAITVRTRRVARALSGSGAPGAASGALPAQAIDGVEITVTDTGRGIPPHLLPHVFEPFFSSKPRGEGSGLGLAISKQIVDSFGGRIRIASELGRGTTVSIVLPAAESPRAAAREAPGDRGLPAGRRARILVVDDEAAIASALRRLLAPHEVDVAATGRTALHKLQDGIGPDVDVILCDLMLPDIAGSEIFRRAIERRPELRSRFIFMTGGAFVPEGAAFLEQCGCRVLDKPFDLERLQRYVIEVAAERDTGGVSK